MRTKILFVSMVIGALLLLWGIRPFEKADAQERLRYSCSAQVYEAFEEERLELFTRETGIEVELFVASSSSSINRLMYGYSDIASTARGLRYPQKESGYVETPFCRAPLAIIANCQCSVPNVSEVQLADIFSGDITNWKEIGGPDMPIVVVVPARNTAAYRNFERAVMRRKDMKYDLMTYKSTMVIETVNRFPGAISFAALGAVAEEKELKIISVNGLSPKSEIYPYYQIFSFVTKGEPFGHARTFVGFAFTEMGQDIIKKRSMRPISR